MAIIENTSSPKEDRAIAQVVEAVLTKQRRDHRQGEVALRNQHAKSHGVVKARFRVLAGAPWLKVGLFAEPRVYDAVVRFSNGGGGLDQADALPNVRGVAIKVLGVEGQKLLPGEENSTEHDFLLANHPTFFCSSIEELLFLMNGDKRKLPLKYPRLALRLGQSLLKPVANPLHLEYFSQVPYRLGGYACKYFLKPADCELAIADLVDGDFLRHALEDTLKRRPWRFILGVEMQSADFAAARLNAANHGERRLIEDPSINWNGPQFALAELTILRRAEPVRKSDGEDLSFNPWRVLPEHEPLGWVGRTRKAVYAADFKWRTEENAKLADFGKPGGRH